MKKNESLLDKIDKVTILYDLYGELLTSKQKDILEKYYFYNLSLTEISDLENISRSAVLDSLNKSVKKLEEYEEKLKFEERIKKIETLEDIKFNKENVLKILRDEERE